MTRILALMLFTTALAGCTLGWGASYNMIASSPDMVQYEYELQTVNEASMSEAALKYCRGYHKKAILESRVLGGYEYINTYRCVAPIAPLSGM